MQDQDQRLYQVALTLIPGIGDVIIKTLISYCGSAQSIFKSPKNKLCKIPGIGEKTASSILSFKGFGDAENELKRCENHGIKVLFITDPEYPKKLKECVDSPALLYFKGNVDLNSAKSLSIVGTRQSTSYGKDFLEQFVKDLATHSPVIVSGLAYGIDITAHKEALKNNLPTVAVMANGMDNIYPSAHKKVAAEIQETGGLLTEFQLGKQPEAHHFPARNRIIAGMTDATIVVEASEKGGALITADIAHSYNKEVFAVPGNFNNKFSTGCNNLIKKYKATILTSVKDLEYHLGWENGKADSSRIDDKMQWMEALNNEERKIVEIILDNKNDILIDDLSWKTQIPLNLIATHLLNLELNGIVKTLPGKRYAVK